MSDSTSVKLRDGLRERIRVLAADANRTPNQLMNEALLEYVERHEHRAAFLAEAEARWTEYKETGERIPLGEAEQMLDALLLNQIPDPSRK